MAAESDKLPIDHEVEAVMPRHVAVIMDGNGRWAEQRRKARHAGHRAGVAAVRNMVEYAVELGIDDLTVFAFSSENWSRPQQEVGRLMALFFDVLQREVDDLHRNNVRLRFMGQLDLLNPRLLRRIQSAEKLTADNGGLRLNVAMAYGGRWDLTNACKTVATRVAAGELAAEDVNEASISAALALSGTSDPDLLIRTGGERRLSNFLLWNLAYAELYFCDCLWPDFGRDDFRTALDYYARRQRRFGKTAKQIGAA